MQIARHAQGPGGSKPAGNPARVGASGGSTAGPGPEPFRVKPKPFPLKSGSAGNLKPMFPGSTFRDARSLEDKVFANLKPKVRGPGMPVGGVNFKVKFGRGEKGSGCWVGGACQCA